MHQTTKAIVFVLLMAAGCTTAPPAYVEPADATISCLLIGENGAYIQQVNGAVVPSGQHINPQLGGNRVRCPAGALRLKIYVSSPEGSAQWTFFVLTEPGATYSVRRSDQASLNVDILDRATRKKINVE